MSRQQTEFVRELLERSERVAALFPVNDVTNSHANALRHIAQQLETLIPKDEDVAVAVTFASALGVASLDELDQAVRDKLLDAAKEKRRGDEAKAEAERLRLEAEAARTDAVTAVEGEKT